VQEYVPYIVIGAVAAALITITVLLARAVWRRQVRHYIVTLTGHREAVASALKTTEAVLSALLDDERDALAAFVSRGSDEREALAAIAERMQLEHAELKDIALPKRLWPLADTLCGTAGMLAEETARVGDAEGEDALDALAGLDIARVRSALEDASAEIARLAERYNVTDPSIYGGGLYI
jgi:hypothetical protein